MSWKFHYGSRKFESATLLAICYQVEPPFENFQILGVLTSQMMTNGTQNLLKKKIILTKIASAAANFLC